MEKYHVLCGIDRKDALSAAIGNKKVALLTAASGVDRMATPTWRILRDMGALAVLFAPEHGICSNLQDGRYQNEQDTPDPLFGVCVYNLNSKGHPRLDEILSGVDAVVYDIQDVGARYYTYLCNLTQIMRAAVRVGIPVIVLDRPNPIGGVKIEGEILDEKYSSFIGEFAIPTRYGMTVGEYARYVNAEKGIGCDLQIIACAGWKRHMYADQTDQLFVNPSPNIPSVNCAINYIATGIFEATNISEGRGTTRPFDMIGAPYVDAFALAEHMNSQGLPGVIFRAAHFTPAFNKHAGELCGGVELHIVDREAYSPFAALLYLFDALRKYPEFESNAAGLRLRFGDDTLSGDFDPAAVLAASREKCGRFREEIKPYLLYD
ncbi:MAG: DUF1343 domain-containing protein [Clostridia bacterium]|nr:DUF1343 domain-containing protein [Clostridia bacterium]